VTDLGRQLEELTQVVVQSTSTLPTNSSQPASKIELSELDNERIPKSLTHMEMARRLDIAKSTLSGAKIQPDFAQWSQERDPDGLAWTWNPKIKRFVPAVDNQ
jgi:hypothetical protein